MVRFPSVRDVTTAPFDLAQTDKLLTTTRSVRKRLDLAAPVDLDEIQTCIDIACQAPTGGNVQDWRWVVVTDPGKRAALAELYNRAAEPYFDANRKSIAERGVTDMDGILDSAEHLAAHLAEVPVHVVPCIFGRPEGQDTFTLTSWYGRIFPAVWSLILALRTRGYGTTLTTLHLPFEAEAAELLGIPPTVHQVALLPIAKHTGTDFKPGRRRPVTEITYWNGWKGTR
jgi:nitroreductase